MIKVLVIFAAVVAAGPCYAQEVRVFSGNGIEHVYGPGERVLDGPELRAKNEQVQRQLREEQWEAAEQFGQGSMTVETSRRQTPRSWWTEVPYQPPKSAWSDWN